MCKNINIDDLDDNLNFTSISDFKWCMECGGEVIFIYNEKEFSITHTNNKHIRISESFKQETEKICKDINEAFEYIIDGVRLGDIITEIEVFDRTI